VAVENDGDGEQIIFANKREKKSIVV